jgi:hypothetical protein
LFKCFSHGRKPNFSWNGHGARILFSFCVVFLGRLQNLAGNGHAAGFLSSLSAFFLAASEIFHVMAMAPSFG